MVVAPRRSFTVLTQWGGVASLGVEEAQGAVGVLDF